MHTVRHTMGNGAQLNINVSWDRWGSDVLFCIREFDITRSSHGWKTSTYYPAKINLP